MNANDIENALRARAAFNDSVEHIDADTRRRLRELRLHALSGKAPRARASWLWPVGAAALAASLAAIVLLPPMQHAPSSAIPVTTAVVAARPTPAMSTTHPAQTATINEIVASDPIETVDPDMLSDLDFYGWLAKQPSTDASGG